MMPFITTYFFFLYERRHKKTCLLGNTQTRLGIIISNEQITKVRSDCADACMQAGLHLCCSCATKSGFLSSRPIYSRTLTDNMNKCHVGVPTVKPVLSGHSKIDKMEILMTNGSLMKVDSIAECSRWIRLTPHISPVHD